jgi:hypothetical protein
MSLLVTGTPVPLWLLACLSLVWTFTFSSHGVSLIQDLGLRRSIMLLLRSLGLQLPRRFMRRRLHDLLLALTLYLRPVGVLDLRVWHLRRTLRHLVGLKGSRALLKV